MKLWTERSSLPLPVGPGSRPRPCSVLIRRILSAMVFVISFPMRFLLSVCVLSVLPLLPAAGQGSNADYARALGMGRRFDNKVFRDGVEANWLPDGNQFWYRVETGPDQYELVLVDAAAGIRKVVADPATLPQPPVLKSSEMRLRLGRTRRTGPACRLTIVNQ